MTTLEELLIIIQYNLVNLNPGAYLKFVQGPMLPIQLHKSPLTLWTTQQHVRVKQKKAKNHNLRGNFCEWL